MKINITCSSEYCGKKESSIPNVCLNVDKNYQFYVD